MRRTQPQSSEGLATGLVPVPVQTTAGFTTSGIDAHDDSGGVEIQCCSVHCTDWYSTQLRAYGFGRATKQRTCCAAGGASCWSLVLVALAAWQTLIFWMPLGFGVDSRPR